MTRTRPAAPGSTSTLRSANQQRVLGLLRSGGTYAQADLARETGLAPATVSNIVRALSEVGLAQIRHGSGRRGSEIRLALGAGTVAGVDFGHSHVAVAIADLTGAVIDERRAPLPSTHEAPDSLARAGEMLADLTRGLADTAPPPTRVGLGLAAPLSDGVVRSSGVLPGWRGVDGRRQAEEILQLPVEVENDANLGALAEHRLGVARGCRNSVFVKLSSGVGAGIVLDDRLFHGRHGTAGELGHLTLDETGPICRCGGRGCLEVFTSASTVIAMTADLLTAEDGSSGRHPTIDDVVAAAGRDHLGAQRALEDAGLHLGWGLAAVSTLLDPDMIVIGGDMARAGDLLLDSVRTGLRRHAIDAVAQIPLHASELGERASLVGAVLLAAEATDLTLD